MYTQFLQLLQENYQQLSTNGMFQTSTLDAYLQGTRKARPATIMAAALALGKPWQNYV